MRRFTLLALSVSLLLAFPAIAPAQTQTSDAVQEAVDAFTSGDSVYVAPEARSVLAESQEEGLQEQIERAGGGIMLAVFPRDAGSPDEIGGRLIQGTGRGGTYGVLVADDPGNGTFRAGSSEFPREVPRIADESTKAGSASQILAAFVTGVERARQDEGAGSRSGGGFLGILLLAGLGLAAFSVLRNRRRRKREHEEQMSDLRRVANDDLLALGADIRALDLDIEMPGVSRQARERYGEAVEAYEKANDALRGARSPRDFEPIGKLLEEGRYDIAAARAGIEGREAPERRPPCFFDPRHGPSVTDVEWAPPGGEPRAVPVCAADAVRLEEGDEPMSRVIIAGGRTMPYWQAPNQFAPFYAGGMFGGFGGIATGLLFGSMLYGSWGAGDAWAGGGGFGGGDFGGGDFGGFGGGDFGGGGFGGGDF